MFCNDGATPIVRLLLLGCRVTVTLSSFFEHIHTLLETAVGRSSVSVHLRRLSPLRPASIARACVSAMALSHPIQQCPV
jgi:hypothetical protein